MLSETEKQQIDAEAGRHEQRRGALIEALRIVQKRRGWVDDEGVADVAEALGLTADEVDGVATAYNMIFRSPVGRHVILLCDSISCWATGYAAARDHLQDRLGVPMGRTTADGRFTWLPVACLGACDVAPAMMVDEDLHGNLTPQKIDQILGRYE